MGDPIHRGAISVMRSAAARTTERAANNLALVFVARKQADAAVGILQGVLKRTPGYEAAYVTLAKIHFSAEVREGIAVLGQLLERNPTQAVALELLRQWQGL